MKSIIPVYIALIVVACSSDVEKPIPAPPPSEPGFYLSFDDSEGVEGIEEKVALLRVPGISGNAVKFTTLGSVIELPEDVFPSEKNFTFMAWINVDTAVTSRQQILGGWTNKNPDVNSPVNNYGISLIDNRLSFEVSADQNMLSVQTDPLAIVPGAWIQVAVTLQGEMVKLYFNGQLMNEYSIITEFNSGYGNQIGYNYYLLSNGEKLIVDQFFGSLDEVFMDDTVISPSWIRYEYERLLNPDVLPPSDYPDLGELAVNCRPITTTEVPDAIALDSIIVTFVQGTLPQDIDRLVERLHLSARNISNDTIYKITFVSDGEKSTVLEWIQFFEQLCIVETAVPNALISIPGPQPPVIIIQQ